MNLIKNILNIVNVARDRVFHLAWCLRNRDFSTILSVFEMKEMTFVLSCSLILIGIAVIADLIMTPAWLVLAFLGGVVMFLYGYDAQYYEEYFNGPVEDEEEPDNIIYYDFEDIGFDVELEDDDAWGDDYGYDDDEWGDDEW